MIPTSDVPLLALARPTMSPEIEERWLEQGLRRRMLDGRWQSDLDEYIADQIGTTRANRWGPGDTSRCALRDIAQAHATLYHQPPDVIRSRGRARELYDAMSAAGWGALMQRVQRDTIAIREMHLYAALRPDGSLRLQPVYPDDIDAREHPLDPERLGLCRWLQLRRHPMTGRLTYVYEVWDIRNPDLPIYAIEDESGGDVTALYAVDREGRPLSGRLTGEAYPWRHDDGRAYMPIVTYHAQRTGYLYDWRTWHDIVIGSLNVGVYYSSVGHIMRQAAWSQRWSVGVDWIGQDGQGSGERSIVADPSTVLTGVMSAESAQMQIGSWTPPYPPHEALAAADGYTRTLYATSGLDGATISRVSGDPRSGYALAVTVAAQRELQRTYEQSFRLSDVELLGVCASLLGLPSTGWEVVYATIEPATAELMEMQTYLDGEIRAGRMTQIEAYQRMHPGVSEESAIRALAAIAAMATPQTTAPLIGQLTTALDVTRAAADGTISRDAAIALMSVVLGVSQEDAARLVSPPTTPATPAGVPDERGSTSDPDPTDGAPAADD